MQDKEWLTTTEAAESLGISQRHTRELARLGKLKARRDGNKWLIHKSLSQAVSEVPMGIQSEAGESLRRLEDQMGYLKDQVEKKDKQIEDLQDRLGEANKTLADATERHDTIVMQLTRQLEQSQRLLEYNQAPWWRRWFRRERREEKGASSSQR